jgi:hypothetical protein
MTKKGPCLRGHSLPFRFPFALKGLSHRSQWRTRRFPSSRSFFTAEAAEHRRAKNQGVTASCRLNPPSFKPSHRTRWERRRGMWHRFLTCGLPALRAYRSHGTCGRPQTNPIQLTAESGTTQRPDLQGSALNVRCSHPVRPRSSELRWTPSLETVLRSFQLVACFLIQTQDHPAKACSSG